MKIHHLEDNHTTLENFKTELASKLQQLNSSIDQSNSRNRSVRKLPSKIYPALNDFDQNRMLHILKPKLFQFQKYLKQKAKKSLDH